eukprot:XP_001695731.1 predicted protein [Chlamydomonas reinhardtii]
MAAPVDLEEQKKAILPFMQRAQEIQAADPKVAYYCRLYAVEQAMKLTHRAKEVNSLLVATLNQLEKDKAKLELDPAADRIHCLGFALRIFDNADRVDRAGKATERTSKAFYAASRLGVQAQQGTVGQVLTRPDGGISLPPGYKPPLTVITEAQKAAKYAVSALSFEDVHTAVRYLNDALRLLTTQQQQQPHAPGRR